MSDKVKKTRLDIYLLNNHYFETREKARIAIMEGKVFVNNQKEDKPGTMIKEDSLVEFRGEKLKYVSRGGLKLEKAINEFEISLKEKVCVDIGASTGGFTDVMLQNGAKKVFAIDCGTNQLDYKLRIDDRVVSMENTNARYLTKNDLNNENIDFVSVDVSFISLKKIIPVIKKILKKDGEAVLLIKPQFEAGKDLVLKGGIVKDKNIHISIINNIINYCEDEGFKVLDTDFSPIKGPAGNIEYLLYIANSSYKIVNECDTNESYINDLVENAHKML
jgi:23S rRNA (cytidine1920-2'-O)/16S rRNA (cytidine1409-2'-O)-methyltransferase